MKKIISTISMIVLFSAICFAQTGSVRIYNEVKGVTIYIDEINRGVDVTEVTSLSAGKHYIKAMKDGVAIYSDLFEVKEGEQTVLLIKNSAEVQKQILQGKSEEIEKYRANKLDIVVSKKYITQTQSTSQSILFPDYYSVLAYGKSNSTSVTTEAKEWKIVYGGSQELTVLGLANTVGNENLRAEVLKNRKKGSDTQCAGISGLSFAIVSSIVIFTDILTGSEIIPNNDTGTIIEATVIAVALVAGVVGWIMIDEGAKAYYKHSLTLEEAIKQANAYNKNLKAQLSLPPDFE